jgi:magnesium-transporting ATPase (P-type)
VIASDKTGTLTVNEQTAKIILLADGTRFTINGEGYNGVGSVANTEGKTIEFSENEEITKITRIAVFANEGSLLNKMKMGIYGDAMDVALLGMSYKTWGKS